ncbi:MAG TPA: hypothetical protein VL486_14070 [Verrucomicrobiae bacterium]|nr:hypothetical protein [Verrucomicrobiae bacterium]
MKCHRYIQVRSVLFCLQASLAGVLIAPLPAFAEIKVQKSIAAEEAKQHVQETNTVCGVVASTKYLARSKLTFLNLGRPYPDQPFTVVIGDAARPKFKDPPEDFFKGKTICVTGLITTHNDKPQITIDDPAQIEIREAAASTNGPPAASPGK